jgi:hypothetical protein
VSNKKKKNFDSKISIVHRFENSRFFFDSSRRTAIAQRQKEEEQSKGKLSAEEIKRQVRTDRNHSKKTAFF